jgi:hypothetical protein
MLPIFAGRGEPQILPLAPGLDPVPVAALWLPYALAVTLWFTIGNSR